MVARFYFHVSGVDGLIEDTEGADHLSLEAAGLKALEAARQMLGEAIKLGQEVDWDAILIVDEHGNEVMSVPVSEALPRRLRGVSGTEEIAPVQPLQGLPPEMG